MNPKVSVCIITYNHSAYIRQAIESALSQKRNFNIEILIGEDDSTDGTREIVSHYAKQYPDVIRPFFRSQKDKLVINGRIDGRLNFINTLKEAKGNYIALLEGDDFWLDDRKLQLQVDFLDSHPECSLCFHNAVFANSDGFLQDSLVLGNNMHADFSAEDLLVGNIIPTASCLIRNPKPIIFPDWFLLPAMGDWPLYLIIMGGQGGYAHYFPFCMAAYRIHGEGAWSEFRKSPLKNYQSQIDLWLLLLKNPEPWAKPSLLVRLIDKNYRRIIKSLLREHALLEAGDLLDKRMALVKRADLFYFKSKAKLIFLSLSRVVSRGKNK